MKFLQELYRKTLLSNLFRKKTEITLTYTSAKWRLWALIEALATARTGELMGTNLSLFPANGFIFAE